MSISNMHIQAVIHMKLFVTVIAFNFCCPHCAGTLCDKRETVLNKLFDCTDNIEIVCLFSYNALFLCVCSCVLLQKTSEDKYDKTIERIF